MPVRRTNDLHTVGLQMSLESTFDVILITCWASYGIRRVHEGADGTI